MFLHHAFRPRQIARPACVRAQKELSTSLEKPTAPSTPSAAFSPEPDDIERRSVSHPSGNGSKAPRTSCDARQCVPICRTRCLRRGIVAPRNGYTSSSSSSPTTIRKIVTFAGDFYPCGQHRPRQLRQMAEPQPVAATLTAGPSSSSLALPRRWHSASPPGWSRPGRPASWPLTSARNRNFAMPLFSKVGQPL